MILRTALCRTARGRDGVRLRPGGAAAPIEQTGSQDAYGCDARHPPKKGALSPGRLRCRGGRPPPAGRAERCPCGKTRAAEGAAVPFAPRRGLYRPDGFSKLPEGAASRLGRMALPQCPQKRLPSGRKVPQYLQYIGGCTSFWRCHSRHASFFCTIACQQHFFHYTLREFVLQAISFQMPERCTPSPWLRPRRD